MIRDLCSSITEKFNGYEIIKHQLARKEKIEFTPINIVYEPIYDENVPVSRCYTNQIHLAYRNYLRKIIKRKGNIEHRL